VTLLRLIFGGLVCAVRALRRVGAGVMRFALLSAWTAGLAVVAWKYPPVGDALMLAIAALVLYMWARP
jgi:hypothetical protein